MPTAGPPKKSYPPKSKNNQESFHECTEAPTADHDPPVKRKATSQRAMAGARQRACPHPVSAASLLNGFVNAKPAGRDRGVGRTLKAARQQEFTARALAQISD